MPADIHVSVVIPVYNKWELTEACLRSLHLTLQGCRCEVIVVDNASTDATPSSCQALGEALFGDLFRYRGMERNINFGPASNLGAREARGEYVLFLNNDTLALPECPRWLDLLMRDFTDCPDIAATGPVLLYPPKGPLGGTVQHLGVFVSPTLKVGHLYEGIPATSELTKKRRFFQIITAACMLMPRSLFLEHGGFNEGYINGFEDVDLCARLWNAGYRMTVNPEARLYHLTSQTPGRHTHEAQNSALFTSTTIQHITPDWHVHLKGDGLELQLGEWQTLSPGMPKAQSSRLAPLLRAGDAEALCDAIAHYPLWHEGYAALAETLERRGDIRGAHEILLSLAHLRPVPEHLFALLAVGKRLRDGESVSFALNILLDFCLTFERYLKSAEGLHIWAKELGLDDLAGQLSAWQNRAGDFRLDSYLPFLRRMREITRGTLASPLEGWAYTLWRELQYLPQKENASVPLPEVPVAFSVLMPVCNPRPEHLRAAVDSLLRQEWPHWELCMADDASSDPDIVPLLRDLAASDPRIRVEFREENGNISAATNTALAMARHEYAALMDQDDLLTPDALREMAAAIAAHPDGLLFYSDEDKVMDDGAVFYPFMKKRWDFELLYGQNFVNHLGVYVTERLRGIGGFRLGYEGAQDYDMLFRYTENAPESSFVHVPKVLYHWRSHSGSTAADIGAKPQVLTNALRALQEHLDRLGVAGTSELVPGTQFTRVRYSLPKPAPLVSLVLDLGMDAPLAPFLTQTFLAKAGYLKLELVLLYDAETEPFQRSKLERWATGKAQVRLLPLPHDLSFAERANAATAAAAGSVIGFFAKGVVPLTQDWLAEMLSRVVRPKTSVVCGKLIAADGTVHHAGHMIDADGRLFSLFRGLPAGALGYFSWGRLAHTVASADPYCFFTHKRLLEECRGFDPAMGNAAAIDFCLRLGENGLRTVVTPFAEFLLTSVTPAARHSEKDEPWESGIFVNEPALYAGRQKKLQPCHPFLSAGMEGWTLHWTEESEAPLPTAPLPDVESPVRREGKEPFRILFVAHDRFLTGAPTSLLPLIRWLREHTDYEMGVLALLGGELLEEFEQLCPVEVVRDENAFAALGPRPTSVEVERVLPRLLRRMSGKPHCIFGNTAIAPPAYPGLAGLEVPIVTRVMELQGAIQRFVHPQIVRDMQAYTGRFVADSSPIADMLKGMGVAEKSITVIHGGITDVATQLDTKRRETLLRNANTGQAPPVLWGCGTLGRTKDTDLFYDACVHLYELGVTDFQAVWAGPPDDTLKEWINRPKGKHPAQERISFAGYIPKPHLLMRPGDLFLLTSREDSFPQVALEAAERGLPILAFKGGGGMADVVIQGAGLLAEHEDARHMARLAADLLRAPQVLSSMGQKARQIVVENFTLDQLGQKYVRLFEEIRAGNDTPAANIFV